ncbi:MAG: hypothetical protein ABSA41_11955 [Terriglobia bacterium]|jgi:hypothetical protein
MAAVIEVLLILIMACVLAIAAAVFVCYLAYTLPRAWSRSWEGLAQRFSKWEVRADADERRARIEEQINSRSRASNSSREVDSTFVQAAEMSKRISSSLALVKDATKTCCDIQKFTAQVRGANDMQDIAWDPVCSNLRRYVLDGIDVALDALGSYPIMDRKILKQHVGLGALRETCEDCELLKYSVADAPALCSPAKSMGNRPGEEKD